jgi:hypothetical protein
MRNGVVGTEQGGGLEIKTHELSIIEGLKVRTHTYA